MKLIVGLGNPGDKYKGTRHNVGFMLVDWLVEELRTQTKNFQKELKKSSNGKLQYIWFEIKGRKVEFIKPETYMNNSGRSVAYAFRKHSLSPEDLYVIHDDLDISLGEYKIQKGKGPRDHNGLNSIYKETGKSEFWHVRVGIDNREEDSRISGETYVLQKFEENELAIINNQLEEISDRLLELVLKD